MLTENVKEVAIKAAKEAGKILLDNFRRVKEVRMKEVRELLSNVDLESEERIIQIIKKSFPQHTFLSEEMGKERGQQDYVWIIDPLDGTHNYIYGQPAFGLSIALAQQNEVILGVINLPFYGELFYAEKGKGAYLNGRLIHPSDIDKLSEAYILYDPQLHKRNDMFDNLARLYPKCFTLRIFGCAVYDACSVASGRAEARIWHKTKTVDVAAGSLIVKEAGGKVTDFNGNPYSLGSTEVIVSNGKIHDELVNVLKHKI